MNDKNGVFEGSFEDDDSNIETNGFFWRFDGKEKGPFFDLQECVRAYCASLTDLLPEMAALFTGKTWPEIYALAGISKDIISKLRY